MSVNGRFAGCDSYHMQGIDAQTLGKKAKTSPNKIGMLCSCVATWFLMIMQHAFSASSLADTYFVKSSRVSVRRIHALLHLLNLKVRRLRSQPSLIGAGLRQVSGRNPFQVRYPWRHVIRRCLLYLRSPIAKHNGSPFMSSVVEVVCAA
jgi:hypothetical protein